MPFHQKPIAKRFGLIVLTALAIPFIAVAQQPGSADTSEKATIQALLVEVRQLRIALEHSTSLLPRIQVSAQRVQAQQDRVDRLSRELRDWRRQMTQNSSEKDRAAAMIKQVEEQLTQNPDPTRRHELEGMKSGLGYDLERQTTREQQDRQQEAELVSQLQAEQAKLNAMTEELDNLEKALGTAQQ